MTKKRHKSAPKAARAVAESPLDGPTREWRRHHDATRASETHAWVRRTRVQQLYDAGRIGRDEVDAAKRYLDDYEIGVAGAHVGAGGDSGGLYADGRLAALTRWREAREAVERAGWALGLLDGLVFNDWSWDVLAEIIGRGPGGAGREAAKRAAQHALTALAGHYAMPRSTTHTGTSSRAATRPSIAR